jgi:HK97 family phage portal protein
MKKRHAKPVQNRMNVYIGGDDDGCELTGGRTSSGVRVTRKKSLGYPAIWRAVNLISGDIAKLKLSVYKLGDRSREKSPKHPAYGLLARKPNEYMTAFVWKQTMVSHTLTEGNGYSYIDRDGAGRPKAMLLLDPDGVEPVRKDGRLWYVYERPGMELAKIPAEDVLHFKGLSYDGLQGYPVIRIMADSIGAAVAARDHSGAYFKNGARPGGAIKHSGKLTETSRRNMRESWERIHSGLSNAHKVAILEEGADYIPFNSNAREAQLLESREFDSREIANIFGVPTHKLGDPSKVAYNSLEQENQSYYDDTLSRWMQMIVEECNDKLLTNEQQTNETHEIGFDYREIQRANLSAQVDYAQKMIAAKVIDEDEGRELFGLNPRKARLPDPAPQPDPTPVRAEVFRGIVSATAERMVRRLTTHAERCIKSAAVWPTWAARVEADNSRTIAEAFGPIIETMRSVGLESLTADYCAASMVELARQNIASLDGSQFNHLRSEIEDSISRQITDKIIGVSA